MRVDGYIRVSRVAGREGERFISPGEQRKAIRSWAAGNGHELAAVHEDLDQPGTKRDRPGLSAAMKRAVAGETEGIIVARLDRFGRSVPHLAGLVEQLQGAGAALFTVAEGIDSRGATGRMLLTILSAIAEFDVSRIRDNWYAARANAVERGLFVGGTVPLGYRRTERGNLIPGPHAQLVRQVFAKRAASESWVALANRLASRTEGQWSVGAVRHLIGNRTYLGEVHGGQGLINRTAHKPLIDRATFEAANTVKGIAPPRSGRASGLLSGILRCAACRYAMKASQGTTRHGKPFLEYRCKAARRENAAMCPAPSAIKARVIEPFVLRTFFEGVGNYRARGLADESKVQGAAEALRDAEAELDAVLDTRLADALGPDSESYLRAVQQRRQGVEEARQALTDARGQAVTLPDVDFAELWPDLSLQEQRALLASVLDAIFVRRGTDVDERTFVCWRGEAPELPVRGRRWTPQRFDFPA